jgi:cytoskeletal protein CcmA (bactofilin family)
MFGKKKDEQNLTGAEGNKPDAETKSHTGPSGLTRPSHNPDIPRRGPDMSAYAPRVAGAPAPTPRGETEQKRLTVGRDIFLNGEIRTCDSLIVEGKVEAVLTDCKSIDIAATGEFKGSAEVESADISGRFDGDLMVRQRLTIRSGGKVLGKIRYGQLEIERGGIVSGQVETLPDSGTV